MPLSENENNWLNHMIRWGLDGYPVLRLRAGKWIVEDFFGVRGAPVVYKTKKQAVGACEKFEQILLDKKAGRL
jgi:hypothetical protein